MFKIVHINTSDTGGGAAIAAVRHSEAMQSIGMESKLLVLHKNRHRQDIVKLHLGIRRILIPVRTKLRMKVNNLLKTKGTFSIMKSGFSVHNLSDLKESDVIFLHWINNDFISLKEVEKILKLGKPTYWYMHDMFPITGGCHHSFDCERYKILCQCCPNIKKQCIDIVRHQFSLKMRRWTKYNNLSFVAPSYWLGKCISESKIAQGKKVYVVPNVIDTNLFKPLSFSTKEIFGLDPQKITILFSADLYGSIYKGTKYTIECLENLDPNRYEGLVIGNLPEALSDAVSINICATGYLSDAISLVLAYNACDILLITSIAENYPNVVLEAMACGKPCVGSNVGGIPDLICHKETGYLANIGNTMEFTSGVEYVANKDNYKRLSENSRNRILTNNSYKKSEEIYKPIFSHLKK